MKTQSLLSLVGLIFFNFLMGWKTEAQVKAKSPLVDPVIIPAPKPKQVYTLAFIVGVSEYDQINGLKYADKDARDFKAYLQSKAGGSVPNSNIVMLTNEDATFERVVNQLEWLKASALSNKIDTSKYQIKVILFFSSHGYEDKIVYKQDTATHGILCLHDTSPGYKDRFLALPFLKDYAEDVAFLKKKVSVNLYIDACRSGALISRTQSSILKEELYRKWRYNNITKIVACLDNQSAYEGDQWENGIFTYYLLRGLRGLADGQEYSTVKPDGIVVVSEIKHYITDWIAKDLSIKLQTPEKEGQDNTVLSIVDSVTLNNLVKKIAIEIPNMQKANPKSFGEHFIKQLSQECQTAYTRFVNNLDLGFMDKAIQDYELLAKITPDQTAKNLIKRELIAGLIDDSYKFLTKYLSVDRNTPPSITQTQCENTINYIVYTLGLLGKEDFRFKSFLAEKLYFEGLLYKLYQKNLISSEIKFKEALQQKINAVYVLNELGLIFDKQKRYSKALEAYDKGLSFSPDWVYLLNNKGAVLFDLKRYEEAINDFNKAIYYKRDFAGSYCGRGNVLFEIGRFEQAIMDYDSAIYFKKDYAEAYNGKGNSLNKLGRYKQAIVALDSAIYFQKNDAKAYANKGNSLYYLKRYEESILFFDTSIYYQKDNASTYYNKGNSLYQLKRYESAIANFDSAIYYKKNYPEAHYGRGISLHQLGKAELAISTYNLAKYYKKDYAEAYYAKGISWGYLSKYKEAISAFDSAIYYKNDYIEAYNDKGIMLHQLREYKSEISVYDIALSYKKDFVEAYYNKGLALANLKQFKQAISAFDSAIYYNKGFAQAYYSKSSVFMYLEQFRQAIEPLEQCLQIEPSNYQAWNRLGICYYMQHNYSTAQKSFERELELNNSDPDTYYTLSRLHSLQNQPKEALSYLEQALQKGYNDFASIKEDTDLDNIRALPEFSTLLKKYQK